MRGLIDGILTLLLIVALIPFVVAIAVIFFCFFFPYWLFGGKISVAKGNRTFIYQWFWLKYIRSRK